MEIYPAHAIVQVGGTIQLQAWCLPADEMPRADLALLAHEMCLTGLIGRHDDLILTAPEFRSPSDG